MESISLFFDVIIGAMKEEFEVYGFTISFWQIYMFTLVGGIVMMIIRSFFSDE